jgi:hypothetical protein
MAEFDAIGREEFLKRYGFGTAHRYFLRDGDRTYDSKAIFGVAYGYEHPEHGPLSNAAFSGGEATVKRQLEALGFEVVDRGGATRADREPRVWLVRAGEHGEAEQVNFDEGVVSIGWTDLPDVGEISSVDEMRELVLPVLREIGARALAEQTGFKIRSIYDVLNRGALPHARRRAVYEEQASAHARRALEALGEKVPASGTAVLQRYLQEQGREGQAPIRQKTRPASNPNTGRP